MPQKNSNANEQPKMKSDFVEYKDSIDIIYTYTSCLHT